MVAERPRTPGMDSTTIRPLLEIPDAPEALPETPIRIQNRLAEHPLFEPERIKELLRRLPAAHTEIRAVETTGSAGAGYKRGPRVDVDGVEAFSNLHTRPTWMLLHDTWKHDADYKHLLEDYLEDLGTRFPEVRRGIFDMGCWMFLSSGGSVVHFHADGDQSFLNNVRGGKTVYVYPSRLLPETVVEDLLHRQDQGAVTYDPAYEAEMFAPVHLGPGESTFLPLYAPHRVTNDDTICISWNVGFNTRASRRRRNVHLVNHDLRSMGMHPRRFGDSPWRDAVKARLHLPMRIKNKVLRTLRPGRQPSSASDTASSTGP